MPCVASEAREAHGVTRVESDHTPVATGSDAVTGRRHADFVGLALLVLSVAVGLALVLVATAVFIEAVR
jgi:hypothetical protein